MIGGSMKYVVSVSGYHHSPLESFAKATECLLAHARASAKVGASCLITDGFFLIIEEDETGSGYKMLGVREVIDIGEEVGLFDEDSNVIHDPEVEMRLVRKLFPIEEGEIRALARAMGLLDPI
jgi:hypothetical protein